MYNTIIVPTDLSDEEQIMKSLKKAETLSDKGRIILLHVLDAIPAYALVEIPQDLMPDLVPKTRDTLKKWIDISGVKADIEVRNGSSYRNIIESAKENEASLILINSHRPGLQDYLLGSTAAKVVRHAPCSVLVDR